MVICSKPIKLIFPLMNDIFFLVDFSLSGANQSRHFLQIELEECELFFELLDNFLLFEQESLTFLKLFFKVFKFVSHLIVISVLFFLFLLHNQNILLHLSFSILGILYSGFHAIQFILDALNERFLFHDCCVLPIVIFQELFKFFFCTS